MHQQVAFAENADGHQFQVAGLPELDSFIHLNEQSVLLGMLQRKVQSQGAWVRLLAAFGQPGGNARMGDGDRAIGAKGRADWHQVLLGYPATCSKTHGR
ncbi:hypothetical protein D3C76_1627740 [compost metagenome]